MTSQLYSIRLTREDTSIPWGFRLEGGTDVGHEINIQKITPGSIADLSGLKAGDCVVRINQLDTKWMKHEDAKMEIIRSNNDLEMLVQRGDYTRSHCTVNAVNLSPVSNVHPQRTSPQSLNRTVWKPTVITSLQMSPSNTSPPINLGNKTPDYSIGASHNISPTPFCKTPPAPGQELLTTGSDGRIKKIVHSSYNSPMGLYNQRNLHETFEQTLSSVSKSDSAFCQYNNLSTVQNKKPASMYCGSCGGFIRGAFVRIQGRVPMHPECLKCCKCGIGLRNVGYFYIREQLYCETHAKQAAPPPAPGMKAVVVYK